MSELFSHCYKHYLDRCEEKWVWKLWGQWTSRRWQLFVWTSCVDVTVTVKTHCYYNQRHQNVYLHTTHTNYRPLARHPHAKPWLQLKGNRESIWMSGPFRCSRMVLKIGGHDRSVYLYLETQASCIKLSITLKRKVTQTIWRNACAGRHVRKRKKAWPVNNAWESNHVILRGLTQGVKKELIIETS